MQKKTKKGNEKRVGGGKRNKLVSRLGVSGRRARFCGLKKPEKKKIIAGKVDGQREKIF